MSSTFSNISSSAEITLYPGNLLLLGGQYYPLDSSNINFFNSEAMVKGFIESLTD